MRDTQNLLMLGLLLVLFWLLISLVDQCRGYEACLEKHSIKTCKANFGKPDPGPEY